MIEVEQFPCLSDNMCYFLRDAKTGKTAAIDAPDAKAMLDMLAQRNWSLDFVLVTHHHDDHTAGIPELKNKTGARIVGPQAEAGKIPGLDRPVVPGENFLVGETNLQVLATPGHTLGHVAYFAPAAPALFCGDALFSLGCGRMFEGEPKSMWAGLAALRNLPDDTAIYCGHEYSAANARFALSIDPDNASLIERAAEIERLRANGHSTLPATLAAEKAQNPFLRADDPGLAKRLGLSDRPAFEVFAHIRALKDAF